MFRLTFMYMESCVFVREDFPKENQKLANKQLPFVKPKIAIFYILCWQIVLHSMVNHSNQF